jgi:hypothetical protein
LMKQSRAFDVADMPLAAINVLFRHDAEASPMSAFDPKRTSMPPCNRRK